MSKTEALRSGVKKWERKERSAEVSCSLQWGSSSRRLLPSAFKAPSFNKWLWHLCFSWEESGDDTEEDTETAQAQNIQEGRQQKKCPPDWVGLRVDADERAGSTSVALRCYIPAQWKHLDWITLQGDQNTNQTTTRTAVDWKWQCWFWLSPALSEALRERIWESNKNWSWSRAANLTRSRVPEAIKQIKKNDTIIILMSYCAYLYWLMFCAGSLKWARVSSPPDLARPKTTRQPRETHSEM